MSDSPEPKSSPQPVFFLLGLTPLLGASLQWGPAMIYGFLFLVIVTSVTILAGILKESAPPAAVFPSALGLSVLLTTLFDVVLSVLLPETRKSLGIYLNLLALNPLVFNWAFDENDGDWVDGATEAALNGLKFWGLISLFGLVRELLGHGTLSLDSGKPLFELSLLNKGPFQLLLLPAGAFFLASFAAALFKWLQPQWQGRRRPLVEEAPAPETLPPDSVPEPEILGSVPNEAEAPTVASLLQNPTPPEKELPPQVAAPEPEPKPEPEEKQPGPGPTSALEAEPVVKPATWGENLESVVQSFQTNYEQCRFLVVGAGNGEVVYYLAMLGMEIRKTHPRFDFVVRGTEAFTARLQTAVEGVFRESLLDFIPLNLKQNYLLRNRDSDHHLVRVTEEPRAHIEFDQAEVPQNRLFFDKPCDLVVLNQSIEFLSEEKQTQFLTTIKDKLKNDGALVIRTGFHREFIPEGFRRTGDQVFRKK